MLINHKGKLFTPDAALLQQKKSRQLWKCAACLNRVVVREAFGKLICSHLGPDCGKVFVVQDTFNLSKRLAALIEQNWRVSVSIQTQEGTITGVRTIPVERVSPFCKHTIGVAMALVQSYWTVFLVGVVDSTEALSELERVAKSLGRGALAVPLLNPNWSELEESLLSESQPKTFWAEASEQMRLDNKRELFDATNELNDAYPTAALRAAAVVENRKAEHYSPIEPQNEVQYFQDILAEVRAQKWARWIERLLFNEKTLATVTLDDVFSSDGWIDIPPIQVPGFWLQFWMVKHSLSVKGRQIIPELLATELAGHWNSAEVPEVIETLTAEIEERLEKLVAKELVRKQGNKFYCEKAFR